MNADDVALRSSPSPTGKSARTGLRPWAWPRSAAGMVLGGLFFAASLTPSLLPRPALFQGLLSGLCLAAGYALGAGAAWLWHRLRLPSPHGRIAAPIRATAMTASALLALLFLAKVDDWQDSVRRLMGLEPVPEHHPATILLVALLAFALLRAAAGLVRLILVRLKRHAPQRFPPVAARILGLLATVLIVWAIASGIVFRAGLHLADSSYRELDSLIEPDHAAPADPGKTGSPASLLDWEDLGRAGREYIAAGPSARDIGAFLRRPALEPIRVYAGLRSGGSAAERARVAASELERTGGFRRSVLVVITPTGTGWVDPAAIDTLEYLHAGDVASVAVQYSYLASPVSLLVEPGYGAEASRALLREVHARWRRLPRGERPKLYLYGLSLGALSSEASTALPELTEAPIDGAFWVGPPFPSRIWRSVTAARSTGSPAWLPRIGDGSRFRFTSQRNAISIPGARWGPTRIVYLQYASDPVTFFEARSFYRRPEWMTPPRGPDVSPHLRWYPVVTFMQLLADIALFGSAPKGFGHTFHPAHHVDAWIAVTEAQGWPSAQVERLKRHLSAPPTPPPGAAATAPQG
ncbi:alpha/beta hydrolase [Sphingosinicella terrae]|uniref:alpha/beta hydrolase n=1 Tax=Sphingosinicella terrae TaxID=2172047 RepID=UPI0025478C85|nr:alpha/beta-hydrolase family protein [Sphingosinicella terrae]